ncbi:MAG TPA: endolytic transglycosylase MltG [Flavobacteriales bacterium]|nr:endolytic transglycosylase MltG [Flavobacteriales bacterium]
MARRKSRKNPGKKAWRIIGLTLVILGVSGIYTGYNLYQKVLHNNVVVSEAQGPYLYIPTGSDFTDVCKILTSKGIVKNINTFAWVAERKNYVNRIIPGKYRLKDGMNNNQLVNLLRSGEQEVVKITFHNLRSLEELSGIVAKDLETDSASLMSLFTNPGFIGKYGFDKRRVMSMFLPNTYEFYWNTSAEDFFKRMAREYKNFWNESRIQKARSMNLSQTEVCILASIVQAEQTIRPDERARVAGLYINRLKKGMKLESDPTVIFAMNDFSVQRVLNADRNIDSPYNTYMYKGLPPGPINMPDISSINAVLNYEKHDYIFMCAKEDFSGYHNFSRTYREHTLNARRYRNELNRRKIYR